MSVLLTEALLAEVLLAVELNGRCAYRFAEAFRATARFATLLLIMLLVAVVFFCVLWVIEFFAEEGLNFFARDFRVWGCAGFAFAEVVALPRPEALCAVIALGIVRMGAAASRASAEMRQPQAISAKARREA